MNYTYDHDRNDRWANTPVPSSLFDPPAVRFLEIFCIVGGSLIIAKSILDSLRCQRLTYGFLFLTNSLLCYRMETVGDWGQHLVYSPRFMRHRLLEFLPLKSPNDPVFVPFTYAVYWTAHSIMLMSLAPVLQRYIKNLTLSQAVVILSLPLNYIFDIVVEGFCTYMGWWTYDPGMGPVILWPGGGRQPLTWPILLMTGWPNLIAYWGGKPPLMRLNTMERWFRLDKWTEPNVEHPHAPVDGDAERGLEVTPLLGLANSKKSRHWRRNWSMRDTYDAKLEYRVKKSVPRWEFEATRFVAWFIFFQVSFFVTLIIPLVGLRMLTGQGSIYVP